MSEKQTDEERQRLDHSPSSTAKDPSDARYDEATDTQVGRHSFTTNATFTKETLSRPDPDRRWADNTDVTVPWQTLNQANRYYSTDPETSVGHEQNVEDCRNDCRSWGQRIGLTAPECRNAVGLLEEATRGTRNEYGMEAVVLAALTLAANHEVPVVRSLRANGIEMDTPDGMIETYEDIRQTLDIPTEDVRECRSRLREHL
jgi:hypothetical protein